MHNFFYWLGVFFITIAIFFAIKWIVLWIKIWLNFRQDENYLSFLETNRIVNETSQFIAKNKERINFLCAKDSVLEMLKSGEIINKKNLSIEELAKEFQQWFINNTTQEQRDEIIMNSAITGMTQLDGL